MQTLKDILSMIQYHYHICLDENSLDYLRLVTHLRFFIERLLTGRVYEDHDEELNKQVKMLYPKKYECILKIRVYVRENFQIELSMDEETYLILHIHRVTNRAGSKGGNHEI